MAYPLHRSSDATTPGAPLVASPDLPALERDVLAYWHQDGTFQASIDARPAGVDGANEFAIIRHVVLPLLAPAIGAVILIVGIGGNIGFAGGFLPIPILQGLFPQGWPAIATSAVAGILLNLVFVLFKPAVERGAVAAAAD